MKPCDARWRDQLLGHALGQSASPALTEHLASCAACSAALREWQARLEQVDAGVRFLAASEPSPHAASRLIAELRARPQRTWAWTWPRQAAVFCAFILVAAFSGYEWRLHQQHQQAAALSLAASGIAAWKSPTAGLLQAPAGAALNATPQLGKYFYPLNTAVPAKENLNP